MYGQYQLKRDELKILQKEEEAIKQLIAKYQNTLNRLQVEELTLRSQLVRIHDVDLMSRTTTPQEFMESSNAITSNEIENANKVLLGQDITMNELQINKSTLNLDAAPLIQRMLHDSQVYEEEEDEEDEEEEVKGSR